LTSGTNYKLKIGADDERFSATQAVLNNLVKDLTGSLEPESGVEIYCVYCCARASIKATGNINATPLSRCQGKDKGLEGYTITGYLLLRPTLEP
jgi:hypothetical protein